MSDCLVYALQDPRTEHFRYIGLSTRGMARPKVHLGPVPDHDQTYRANWLRNLKAENGQPVIHVVEYCDSDEQLSEAEDGWIEHFRLMGCPLTNLQSGGFNGRPSVETRAKIGAAQLGRKRTPEAIENLRRAKLGIKNPMYGKPVSAETREKRATSLRGEKNHRFGVPVPGGEATRFQPGHQTWNKGQPGLSGEQHPMFGKRHTDASRRQMSESKAGQEPWNKGLTTPSEVVAKMRATKQSTTHCRRGHCYTEDNTVIVPEGRRNAGTRQCLTCRKTARKAAK